MKTENIVIGNLKKVEDVEVYDMEEQYEKKRLVEQGNPNVHYICFTHSYSLSDVSEKSYYFRIPFGKFKGKYIDLKNIDTIISLIRVYFSLFGINEFPVYSNEDDKAKEYENGMCKVGDIYLGQEGRIYYYKSSKSGISFPEESISFNKIKQLIKNNQIKEIIHGKE